ncbi:hypothetical protein GCM10020254_49960 [Streptomyces goshikiensis]
MGSRRGHAHADGDADQRQHDRGRQGRLDLFPLGAQTALGEDHDERRVPDDLGELGIVEHDVADAVLAYRDTYAEVNEQAGEAAARGDAHRRDSDEQYERADQQELIERVDGQRAALLNAPGGSVLPATSSASTSLPYLIFDALFTR